MKEINEMKERVYQVCFRFYLEYVANLKSAANEANSLERYYAHLAESYRQNYKGACEVYEALFKEEFILKDSDRSKVQW